MEGMGDYGMKRKRVRVVVEKDEAGNPKRAVVGNEDRLWQDGLDVRKIKKEGGEVLDDIDD